MSTAVIVVGNKDMDQQIVEYTESGDEKAPTILYKRKGLFGGQGVLNVLTDVTQIRILDPEQSRELAKHEAEIKGRKITKHFGLVGVLIGVAAGKMTPVNPDRCTVLLKLHDDSTLIILVDKAAADSLSG